MNLKKLQIAIIVCTLIISGALLFNMSFHKQEKYISKNAITIKQEPQQELKQEPKSETYTYENFSSYNNATTRNDLEEEYQQHQKPELWNQINEFQNKKGQFVYEFLPRFKSDIHKTQYKRIIRLDINKFTDMDLSPVEDNLIQELNDDPNVFARYKSFGFISDDAILMTIDIGNNLDYGLFLYFIKQEKLINLLEKNQFLSYQDLVIKNGNVTVRYTDGLQESPFDINGKRKVINLENMLQEYNQTSEQKEKHFSKARKYRAIKWQPMFAYRLGSENHIIVEARKNVDLETFSQKNVNICILGASLGSIELEAPPSCKNLFEYNNNPNTPESKKIFFAKDLEKRTIQIGEPIKDFDRMLHTGIFWIGCVSCSVEVYFYDIPTRSSKDEDIVIVPFARPEISTDFAWY